MSGGDKFDGVEWTPGVTGSPIIDGSLATVECTLGAIYEGGDHELVTGHVVDMEIGKGSPCCSTALASGDSRPERPTATVPRCPN